MKISVFYPHSLFSAWSVSEGLCDTLFRMGHTVVKAPIDPSTTQLSRAKFPSLDVLNECDMVLVSGPEHIRKFIDALYHDFGKLKAKKVGYFHETIERSDYGRLDFENISKGFDALYTPAAQDEKYGMKFLPFGVDTEMFRRCQNAGTDYCVCESGKDVCDLVGGGEYRDRSAIFIGLLYGARAEFVKKHGLESLIQFGNCQVQDLDGVNIRKSVELYASELKRSKILVNLPSLCRHAVTKITEGAACGSVVVTHKVEDERNHILKSGVYYESGEELKAILEDVLANDSKREEIARKQCEEVHSNHRLDQRLQVILES